MNMQQEQDDFIPVGYERCPICEVLVNGEDLVNHIRHGGCRLYKARERELIAAGQGETPCPICKLPIARTAIREHLKEEHPEHESPAGPDRLYRFGANRPVGG